MIPELEVHWVYVSLEGQVTFMTSMRSSSLAVIGFVTEQAKKCAAISDWFEFYNRL